MAIVTMTIDHFDKIVFPDAPLFNHGIGRVAYPLFVYILVYNFLFHTKDRNKYILRLLITGVVSQPIYVYAFAVESRLNILYDLGFALIFLNIFIDKIKEKTRYFYLAALVLLIIALIHHKLYLPFTFEYGYSGMFFSICVASLLVRKSFDFAFFTLVSLFFVNNSEYSYACLWVNLPIVFACSLLFYNKLSFIRRYKSFFYLYYPLHLLLLGLISP